MWELTFTLPMFAVFSKSPDGSQQVDDPEHDSTELEELHVVVELLKVAIGEYITDSQLRHYGEQLLQLTMAYLHKLSRNVVAHLHTQSAEDRLHTGSTTVLTQLSNYVVELRRHMNTKARSLSGQRQKARDLTDGQAGGRQDVQMTPSHKEMVQVWDQLDLKVTSLLLFMFRCSRLYRFYRDFPGPYLFIIWKHL